MLKGFALSQAIIAQFEDQFSGELIQPSDSNYDDARAVWNGMIDRYPTLIAKCQHTSDVMLVVNFARNNNIPFSVRGGGHNVAGSAVINDGLVIDLSDMRDVLVNPRVKTVRVGGGATWRDVDVATQRFQLAVPSGVVSETGVAGLTLGGGVGWMRNKYGLTSDNLLSAEVVLANGQVVTASETENPDLLWALRGGGAGLGIVTNFQFQLHPIGPDVMFVLSIYKGEDAEQVLRFIREYVTTASDEVSVIVSLAHVPSIDDFPADAHGKPCAIVLACHIGNPSIGEKAVQPLRDIVQPLVDFSGVMPYVEVQTLFDHDYPAGEMRYYWKSAYLDVLSDEAIDLMIQKAENAPSLGSTIDIWHLGNGIRNVPESATAYNHRSAQYLIGVEANWESSNDDEDNVLWTQKVIAEFLPFSQGRQYMNFPGFWEGGSQALKAMVGSNFERLSQVRAKYDPNALFRS